MNGFNSLYEKYGLSVIQTYPDIYLLMDLPEECPETPYEITKWVETEIEGNCGGCFAYYNDGKVTFKTMGTEYSANPIVRGYHKAGMLSCFLVNWCGPARYQQFAILGRVRIQSTPQADEVTDAGLSSAFEQRPADHSGNS